MHHIDTITKKEAEALGIINAEGLGFIKPQTAFKNINERILAEIKKGNLVWRQGWRSGVVVKGKTYGAQNYETQRPYTGGNAFFINMQNLLNGTNYRFFLTQKQILERGGKLKKNAIPFPVSVFIKNIVTKEVKVKGEVKEIEAEESGVIWYEVFPIDMVDGLKEIKRKTHKPDTFNEVIVTDADTLIENMPKAPPIKHGGDKAFYVPSMDYVQLPHKKAFKPQQNYYSVAFHELIHSTGHSKRLDRGNDTRKRDGSKEDKKAYAFEELIAEIGAAYLCGVCEIDYYTINNSAAYLKNWASRLTTEIEEDPNFLKRVVFKAARAANYIIGKTLEKHGVVVNDGKKNNVLITSETSEKTPTKKENKSKKVKVNFTEGIETPNFSDLQKKVSVLNLKRFQELRTSFEEGYLILKSGKNISGKKYSQDELEAIKKSVLKTLEKINGLVIETEEEETPSLEVFEQIVNESKSLEEAFRKIQDRKNVPSNVATFFYDKYNPNGKLTAKEAFTIFYKEIKGDAKPSNDVPDFTGDIPYKTAYAAHYNTSFSPEKRAKQVIENFESQLEAVYNEYDKATDKGLVLSCFNEYRQATAKLYITWLGSRSNLASSAIVGPARFPVARMEKLNRYAENHYSRYVEVSDKLIKKHKTMLGLIAPSGIIKSGSENALTELKEKLAKLEKEQEQAKQINKAIRSKNPLEALLKLGVNETEANKLLQPNKWNGKGIPLFALANRNAEIRRIKDRIAAEEKLNTKRETGNEKFTIDGGYILRNFEANRYQIYFDAKPDEAMRTKLKSHGFKWSPNAMAWQSFLSPNTAYKIKLMFGDVLKESTVIKPTEKPYTGKEITPNKTVEASIGKAIKDLLTLPKYSQYSGFALSIFYNVFKDTSTVENLRNKIAAKLFEEKLYHLFEEIEVDYTEKIKKATINKEGEELIDKIASRVRTLKAKKSGTDLFPELAGTKTTFNLDSIIGLNVFGKHEHSTITDYKVISKNNIQVIRKSTTGGLIKTTSFTEKQLKDLIAGKKVGEYEFIKPSNSNLKGITDAVLIFINAFLATHDKTVTKEDLAYILATFQTAIKSGAIKAKHPLATIANQTQDKLVKLINTLKPKQKVKLHISNKAAIENKVMGLHGLGFWNVIASAVIGKSAEYLAMKALKKKEVAAPTTNGLNGIEGFTRADKSPEIKAPDTYRLNGELGKLLGDIQPYKYSIVLTGDPHAGKTEFTMQLANGFAEVGKTVGAFMLEQGGLESKDTKAAIERNVTEKNKQNVYITGEASKGIATVKEFANKFNVIIIDSWQKLGIPSTKFDSLRHEFPNTIFIVIFQQNGEGGTRGGVVADYDTPVLLKVHKVDATFENNYVEVKKNRGNAPSLALHYMVKAKKTVNAN